MVTGLEDRTVRGTVMTRVILQCIEARGGRL